MMKKSDSLFSQTLRRRFLKNSALLTAGFCFNLRAENRNAEGQTAVSPKDEIIRLFNGKDLTGLYGWLKGSKFEDPHKVFTVKDGVLRISGEDPGYLATQKQYRNYHLVVEYKWGSRTDGSGTV